MADLLIVLSILLHFPYPSVSPSDCYYKCTCISTLYFLYLQMTHRNFSFTSYFCYHSALFPLSCPSISISAALSSVSTNLPHFTMVLLSPQESEADFCNIGSMMECGLFMEALDTLRSAVFPGLLPPAPFLIALLEYAQQVGPQLQDSEASLKLVLVQFWLFRYNLIHMKHFPKWARSINVLSSLWNREMPHLIF